MEYWHGFETARNVAQMYETTIADVASDLSAFEQPSLSADSLGNILTAQGYGEAGYVYHEATETPLLAVAIPAGVVISGSAPGVMRALESGFRQRLMEFTKSRSGEHQDG